MAKAKKSRKLNADAVYVKKSVATVKVNPFASATPATSSKRINPFEVHVNKEKFKILGRTCKHDKGLPGVSRAKAEKKRSETLALEFRDKHKTNRFQDRRIGKHLTPGQLTDDVVNARFIAEKIDQLKKQSKASRFNLNDDEVLTHRGQTLEDIENFRDERSDDEEEDNVGLDADFTEAAHFGGTDDASVKDRKAAIDEMILEQKRRKVEIAKEKDEVHDLTEKLDSNYKTLVSLMGKMTKSEMKSKHEPDDYDKVMREMIFEPRGVVTDKLLSEEELAKKEKERLEKLENERLKRMHGDAEIVDSAKPTHRSADDLDDGYFASEGIEEEEGTLAYHLDGQLGTQINGNMKEKAAGEEASDDSDAEEDDDVEEEVEEEEEESDSGDNVDNLSDLRVTDSEPDTEAEKEDKPLEKNQKKKSEVKNTDIQSKETAELPFTIDMPDTYEDFEALLLKHTPANQEIIVERLIKCNHPKLDGVNREKIVKLFAFLLQYFNTLFSQSSQEDVPDHFSILDKLNPHLYDLVHLNPEKMSATLLDVIKEKYREFLKNPRIFPSLETVVIFKLVSNYYSTSDFRHPIVTPCYIFMQHILSQARVRSRQDVAIGLFLVTITLEYGSLSKRFLPAALNFLLGIIFLSIPKRPIEVLKIVPPFQNTGPMSKLLAIAEVNDSLLNHTEELMKSEDLVLTTLSTEFKIRALNTTLKLIKDAINIVSENVGSNYLASPFLEMLERLPLEPYPKFVHTNYATTVEALTKVASKSLTKLVPPAKKPKALRLLEPRIETVYDDKRRPKLTKEKEEKAKLLHKLKRETKGAVREIRRDTEYLQKMRIQQQIQSDMERKEKVKRIFQEASVQQSELNELARLKKKKKF